MANTYTPIASTTLSGTQSSIVFSSIPGTYTDLVLKVSARSSNATTADDLKIVSGSSVLAYYFNTSLLGTGTATTSTTQTKTSPANAFFQFVGILPAASATTNSFGNCELYFNNYTASGGVGSQTGIKQFCFSGSTETNASGANLGILAAGYDDDSFGNAAVTSITLAPVNGSFVSGSTFYLYGIKNS